LLVWVLRLPDSEAENTIPRVRDALESAVFERPLHMVGFNDCDVKLKRKSSNKAMFDI